jgi:hypothetical protein
LAERARVLIAVLSAGFLGCVFDEPTGETSAEGGVCIPGQPGCPDPTGFSIRAYAGEIVKGGGKCLDFTEGVVGSPIFLNDCSAAHSVVVEPLRKRMGEDGCVRRHEVRLRAGTKVIGTRALPPGQGSAVLELQEEIDLGLRRLPRFLNSQTFVLDGDSIIVAEDRDQGLNSESTLVRVVQVENHRGKNGTPLVVAPRRLADNELWKFVAIDGTGRDPGCRFYNDPVCGFVHVAGLDGLFDFLKNGPDPVTKFGTEADPRKVNTSCAGLPGHREEGEVVEKFPEYDKVIIVDSPVFLAEAPGSEPPPPAPSQSLPFDPVRSPPSFLITDGVTLRSDRRGTRQGSVVNQTWDESVTTTTVMFETLGNDIRFTGLRIEGPTRLSDESLEDNLPANGIQVRERTRDGDGRIHELFSRIVIDHNDLSDWPIRAVWVTADDRRADVGWEVTPDECRIDTIETAEGQTVPLPPQASRPNRVQVVRNFIHHNRVQGSGYGVNANSGGFPLIEGNTFVENRHAIAATNSTPETGYRAYSNLVLEAIPVQIGFLGIRYYTHDFDIHGTYAEADGHCGLGGGFTEIAWNSFFGTVRPAFELRGYPCDDVLFQHNVSLQSRDDTVSFDRSELVFSCGAPASPITSLPGWYKQSNPTEGFTLGVGDFDGDGVDDLFLATGAAFYYAPAGVAEWRLLAPLRTDRLYRWDKWEAEIKTHLLFGDFDDDGRTDIVGKNGGLLMVSWGGASEWEVLGQTPAAIDDMAVGDFDGNGWDDLFRADGASWYIAYNGPGGLAAFERIGASSFEVDELRIGDFNQSGTDDLLGDVSGKWQFSDGGTIGWDELGPRRGSFENTFVGDFDGDGFKDDVGHIDYAYFSFNDDTFEYSKDGTHDFVEIVNTGDHFAAWGRFFEGSNQTGLLFWDDDDHLDIAWDGSAGDLETHSRQHMR